MAVKVIRQPKKIALIGAPTSAGAHSPGTERGPAALRAAGLVSRLQEIGYEVTDMGDVAEQLYRQDDESPRARNLSGVVKALEALRPQVEQAVKSGALPIILGGDCTIALATIAGVRRYFPHTSLLWMDGDADLNTPATTPSGCLDGMVVAHIAGRGAPELVRFWSEPPLVREPDIALFGVSRLDPPEEALLATSPMRRYTPDDIRGAGAAAAAQAAADRLHAGKKQIVLHLDVDVISSGEFGASEFGTPAGMQTEEVRAALETFAKDSSLAAINIAEYVPERDPEGAAARLLIDLLGSALAGRLAALVVPEAAAAVPMSAGAPKPAESVQAAAIAPATEPEPAPSSPSPEHEAATSEPAAVEAAAAPADEETAAPAEEAGSTETSSS